MEDSVVRTTLIRAGSSYIIPTCSIESAPQVILNPYAAGS